MSATLSSEEFARYFSVLVGRGRMEPAPVVSVEGRCHHVMEFFLDDLRHIGQVTFDPTNWGGMRACTVTTALSHIFTPSLGRS